MRRSPPTRSLFKDLLNRTLRRGLDPAPLPKGKPYHCPTIGLPWVVLLGFLRLATSAPLFGTPLDPDQALEIVDSWLCRPSVTVLRPGDEHWRALRTLIAEAGTGGNLTTDAHLAAMALEQGAELCSSDADFTRFPRVRWVNPLLGA